MSETLTFCYLSANGLHLGAWRYLALPGSVWAWTGKWVTEWDRDGGEKKEGEIHESRERKRIEVNGSFKNIFFKGRD